MAAERIFAFCATDGTRITRLAVAFDIVFDLVELGMSKTDDSAYLTLVASVHKCNVIEGVAFRYESDHSGFVVFVSLIDPDQRFIPNQLSGEPQRQPVPGAVQPVFGGIKIDKHTIL